MNFLNINFKYIVLLLISGMILFIFLQIKSCKEEQSKQETQIQNRSLVIDSLNAVRVIEVYKARQLTTEANQELTKIPEIKKQLIKKQSETQKLGRSESDKIIMEILK